MLKAWVRKARNHAQITQEQLGEALGVTKANVSGWENGLHKPSYEQVLKISEVTGEPQPGATNVHNTQRGGRLIPIIESIHAGNWREVSESRSGSDIMEFVRSDIDASPDVFAMRIVGNSMTPLYVEGDILLVDPIKKPKLDSYVVAANGVGEGLFRRFKPRGQDTQGRDIFELVPLNPLFDPIRSDEYELRIVGVVIEHHRCNLE
jgi:SOS-response transcriptional repressor LexA